MSEYHDILGVAVDASKGDIKKAYRKLASRHHPDREGGDEEEFKKIKEAYDRVTHPEKYKDEVIWKGPPSHSRSPAGYWNININANDDSTMHFRFNEQRHRQKIHIRVQFELDLESTLHEQTRTIHIPEYNISPIEIVIPIGVRNGDIINYADIPQDNANSYQQVLMVQFIIRPHPDFEIVNHVHLVQYKIVDALDALVGTILNVTTIDGITLSVKLPAGSGNDTKLKIPAKGLKYKDSPNIRGDMYIKISISVPTLTDEEKEIITNLRDKRNNEQR